MQKNVSELEINSVLSDVGVLQLFPNMLSFQLLFNSFQTLNQGR